MPKPPEITIDKANTGPQSPKGSAGNRLLSNAVFIPGEDPEEFHILLNGLIAENQPATATEQILIENMAQNQWIRRRALRLQENLGRTVPGGEVAAPKDLRLLIRYQTSAERGFQMARNELAKAKKQRLKSKIGWSRGGARCHVTEMQDDDPFLLPAHQTGRADFQHLMWRAT